MTLYGGYYKQMSAHDYYPTRSLEVGEFLPNVLGYAQGGIDVFVEYDEAVEFIKKVIDEKPVILLAYPDDPGENKS